MSVLGCDTMQDLWTSVGTKISKTSLLDNITVKKKKSSPTRGLEWPSAPGS